MDLSQIDEIYERDIAPKVTELEALRSSLQKRWKFYSVFIVAAAVAVFVFIMSLVDDGAAAAFIVPLIILIIGIALVHGNARSTFRTRAKDIVFPAIAKALDVRALGQDACRDAVRRAQDAGAVLTGSATVDDGFSGRHRDCDYEFVEAVVTQGSGKNRSVVFHGYILSVSVPAQFSSRIVVAEDRGITNAFSNFFASTFKGVENVPFHDDPDFERHFEVRAENPEDARRLLSPEMRQIFNGFAGQFGVGKVRAAFYAQRFYLAVKDKTDRFEPADFAREVSDLRHGTRGVATDLDLAHRLIDRLHGA